MPNPQINPREYLLNELESDEDNSSQVLSDIWQAIRKRAPETITYGIAKDIWGGLTAPGAAMSGEMPMWEMDEQGVGQTADEPVGRAFELEVGAMAGGLPMAGRQSDALFSGIGKVADDLPIRPAKENLYEVADANMEFNKVLGNDTVSLSDLKGGTVGTGSDPKRVDSLVEAMSGPDGYIERLIVDQDNNVIEGQHRLDALREIGADSVPVSRIVDLEGEYNLAAMRASVEGTMPSDNVHQLVKRVLEAIAEEGSPEAVLKTWSMPGKWDAPFRKMLKVADDLPMDEASRMGRAADMGFDVDVYHGTDTSISSFDDARRGRVTGAGSANEAHWFVDDPNTAGGYAGLASSKAVDDLIKKSQQAERAGKWDAAHDFMVEAEKLESAGGKGGENVLPLKLRGNLKEFDAEGKMMYDLEEGQLKKWTIEAKKEGYDGLKVKNLSDEAGYGIYNPATHYGIFAPKNIRSKFAKFDPSKADSSDILAANNPRAAGTLSALINTEQTHAE